MERNRDRRGKKAEELIIYTLVNNEMKIRITKNINIAQALIKKGFVSYTFYVKANENGVQVIPVTNRKGIVKYE